MTNTRKNDIIKSEKRKGTPKKGDRVDNMNGTYEVIINGDTILATTNRHQACAVFDFYRKEKALFNIREIIIMNAENQYFFKG